MFEDANITRIDKTRGRVYINNVYGRLDSSTLSVGGSILLVCSLVSSWYFNFFEFANTNTSTATSLKAATSLTKASCDNVMFLWF